MHNYIKWPTYEYVHYNLYGVNNLQNIHIKDDRSILILKLYSTNTSISSDITVRKVNVCILNYIRVMIKIDI